jgi:hypothetical protein
VIKMNELQMKNGLRNLNASRSLYAQKRERELGLRVRRSARVCCPFPRQGVGFLDEPDLRVSVGASSTLPGARAFFQSIASSKCVHSK